MGYAYCNRWKEGEREMNIEEAKREIKRTLKLYLEKEEGGGYVIPQVKQRPLFLMGPPGVGKTAIMEQVAAEEGVAMVSYTITHHTRQSAVGLPFIKEKEYDGKNYSTTEYTMSEIIANIYNTIEKTGLPEGILFLDEINCVSETLAPMMLQFLQEKKFGTFSVPEGWVIVTAGNPAIYNKSVKEFDPVTLDRIRTINIEAEYPVWRAYAMKNDVHGAILGYLEIKKDSFYHVENSVNGKRIVTPRGWEDFSILLKGYEKRGYEISAEIVEEYIKDKKIAVDFSNFLEMYYKYENRYRIKEILEKGFVPDEMRNYGLKSFDEKISVVSMLLSGLNEFFINSYIEEEYLKKLYSYLQSIKEERLSLLSAYEKEEEEYEKQIVRKALDKVRNKVYKKTIETLKEMKENEEVPANKELSAYLSEVFKREKEKVVGRLKSSEAALSHAISFMENYLSEADLYEEEELYVTDGSEMVYFISELETNFYSMNFLREHGSDVIEKYGKLLKTGSERDVLRDEILSMKEF